MKLRKSFLKGGLLASMAVSLLMGVAVVGTVSAACVQYDPNGTPTSKTPVFNQFCGVPDGVGNEADFVRIRQNATGNPTTGDNAAYVDSLNSACAVGAKYDVRTYIHNGADPAYNTAGGASAIAHNVVVAQTAKLNQADSNFTFKSTITASNAASVTDTAKLACGNNVVLKLVPTSVHVYSKALGWNGASDSAVNGTLSVGSQVLGSGNQLACWNDRIVVVYEVVVEAAPTPPVASGVCTLLTVEASADRKVIVNTYKSTVSNSVFKNATLKWGDSATTSVTDESKMIGQTHQYSADGTYHITTTVNFTSSVDGSTITSTSASCAADVTFSPTKPPVVTPPVTPPTTLVNTGAGSVVGIFVAVATVSAAMHRLFLSRKLAR